MAFEYDKYFNYVLLFWGPMALIAVYIAGSLYRTVKHVKAFHEEFDVLKDQMTYLAEKVARLELQLARNETLQNSAPDSKVRPASASQPIISSEVRNAAAGSGVHKAEK
jgi:hypothetical protein